MKKKEKKMIKLKIKKITEDAILPTQAHKGDLFDVYCNKDMTINSFESTIVPLGIAMDIPEGYRIKLFSRSSLPLKKKIVVSNGVGIIDTGYKNELGLICHSLPNLKDVEILEYKLGDNHNNSYMESTDYCLNNKILINNPVEIKKGDKIAQIQLEKIEDFEIEEVAELNTSNDRGGGFGSTDNK